MKSTLAAIIALSALFSVHAQEAYQAPLVTKSVLLDIDTADYVVVAGERGHILTSSDGENFVQQAVPVTATLTAVDIVGDDVWVAGHDATIMHSSDRGTTWTVQMSAPELEKPFLDILFFDHQHGVAAGAYGLFFRTRDGGKTWNRELHATLLNPYDQEYLDEVKRDTPEYYEEELRAILPHLNKLEQVGETLYLVGEAGLVAMSDNMGETWTRMDTTYEGSFLDVAETANDTIVIAGLRGHTFVRRGTGEWENVPTCLSGSLNKILPAGDRVRLFGNNGMMISVPASLETREFDPWGPADSCEPVDGLSREQLKDKASIVSVARFNGHLIAVTANGIKQLDMD